ncbi:MAG TPA: glutamate-1-semialdehyde 2,1-aminomutase [Candidatus Thermoplasmatota archaeon]|nr:glutamate-1-semialdehyde 2,1-aminomutase [Candidatus Thermoplasmatota archaeon]
MTISDDIFGRAEKVMPGGVSSPVRAFRAVGGRPRVLVHGEGAYVWDADGRRFLDLQMSFGPLILGHAHPAIVAAVQEAAALGTTFGAPHPAEVALAEVVVRRHPCADWVRFVSSGTEAVMSAIRLARAATGRDLVLKFDGCYHGHADAMLVKGGSGLATSGASSSAGVPRGTIADTAVLPLDDDAALESFFREHGARVACAVVEPVPANAGLLPQRPQWLRLLRRLTRAHDALLLADEVITGFRLGWGGACERYGIDADLLTFGKVLGGGLPCAAYGGRRDLMDLVAPLGPVYQAGTLSGNPLAMAAGLATMRAIERLPRLYPDLDRLGELWSKTLEDAAPAFHVHSVGSILWPTTAPETRAYHRLPADLGTRFAPFHRALLGHGVFLPPSAYEVSFLSTAHDDRVLEEAATAFRAASKEVAA